MKHEITITEEERQTIVLALSQLAESRPGWEPMLRGIAGDKLDAETMFESFVYERQPRQSLNAIQARYAALISEAKAMLYDAGYTPRDGDHVVHDGTFGAAAREIVDPQSPLGRSSTRVSTIADAFNCQMEGQV